MCNTLIAFENTLIGNSHLQMLELTTERSKQGFLKRVDGQLELDDKREQVVHKPEARFELGQLKSDALEELQLSHKLVHLRSTLCH